MCVCVCVCVCVCYTTVASKGIIIVGFLEFPFNQKGMSWTFSRDVVSPRQLGRHPHVQVNVQVVSWWDVIPRSAASVVFERCQ